jgi:O-acetyl-ADP-ribose deacetylase
MLEIQGKTLNKTRIEIRQADITSLEVDAVVNAANNELLLGSGVAGAISRAGGPSIQEECNLHSPINVGEAAVTGAGRMKAKYVIHAASMGFGSPTTARTLKSSTMHSLSLAEEKGVKSIAFPALGTGVSGFPIDACARIMMKAFSEYFNGNSNSSIELVILALFDEDAARTAAAALDVL